MADFQLDAKPYFQILHNLIRQGDLDYEPSAAAASINWVRENALTIRRVCNKAESEILVTIYAYWDLHKELPSPLVMQELISEKQKNQPLVDLMEEYAKYQPDLKQVSHMDLHVYLDQRKLDWEKYKLIEVLNAAGQIVVGSLPDSRDKTKSYTGPRDALKYFHEKVQQGIMLDDVPNRGGLLMDTVVSMRADYQERLQASKNNNLFITTGIPLIDNHLGGLRRKELNGILGYVGQRKSAIMRSIGYHAAKSGFRVLHIPLESDCEEEEVFYTVRHAEHHLDPRAAGITKKKVDRALLSTEEHAAFFDNIVPDFQASVGQNIIVYTPGASRAWDDVRQIIERENDKQPLDLVLIDYLTMLSTPGARDDIADKMAIVQDAKRIALTSNKGRGLCILTPVQGNRSGFDDASTSQGEWRTTGIAKYSELDKSLDNLFYVWFNDELNSRNEMRMGSCKTRRDANIPSTVVTVSEYSGMLQRGGSKKSSNESSSSSQAKTEDKARNVGTEGAALMEAAWPY